MSTALPTIAPIEVVLVAGHDSMLLNPFEAPELYLEHGVGSRDDAASMRYLIPGWEFDAKSPALVR